MLRLMFACLALVALKPAAAQTPPPSALFVHGDAVAAAMREPGVIIIDARGDAAKFADQRLRGARYLDWQAWDRTLNGGLDPANPFWREQAAALGLKPDARIVLYDEAYTAFSAHIWLALRGLGYADVRIVTTRFSVFAPKLPADLVETGPVAATIGGSGALPATPQPAPGVATVADVQALIQTEAPLLFDNRSREEYDGLAATAEGLRKGHIPKALLLPRGLFFGDDGEPLARGEVVRIMARFGVKPADKIMLTCQVGGRSSAVAAVLWDAGFTNVSVYAGSWAEWGSRADLPLVKR